MDYCTWQLLVSLHSLHPRDGNLKKNQSKNPSGELNVAARMSGWQITGPCPTNWRGTRVPVSQNIKPRRTYSGSDKSEKIRQIWENRTRGQIWQMFTRPETTLRSHVNKIIIQLITICHCYFHELNTKWGGVKTNTWFSLITCKFNIKDQVSLVGFCQTLLFHELTCFVGLLGFVLGSLMSQGHFTRFYQMYWQ